MLTITAILCRVMTGFLVVAALLPLLPVGAWMVRLFDFPRLQLVVLAAIPIVTGIVWARAGRWTHEHSILLSVCMIAVTWQLWHVIKYTPVWPQELPTVILREETAIQVAVVNLEYENDEKPAVRKQLTELDSDLLLLIEFDEPWAEALADLKRRYPYREGVVRGDGLGIMLWSKIPFNDAEVRHLVSDERASVFATLDIDEGGTVNFVGVHPTPPGLMKDDKEERHDSRIRDAELMLVAKEIAERKDERWIVTGDFNDVAWSHTTRLFQRLSGLRDPRVGRGLFNTYHAKNPLIRFPIDQVFLSPGTQIVELDRFHPTGSDHFAITTKFVLTKASDAEPEPEGNDREDARQMIHEGEDDAKETK